MRTENTQQLIKELKASLSRSEALVLESLERLGITYEQFLLLKASSSRQKVSVN